MYSRYSSLGRANHARTLPIFDDAEALSQAYSREPDISLPVERLAGAD
jgi:hypothetical protein